MDHHPTHHDPRPDGGRQSDEPDFWRSRYGLGLVVIGAAALYFLLTEHRAHLFSALPYLLVLACPLMHLFMHGGHGGQGGQGRQAGQGSDTRHDCCAPAQDEPARPQPSKQGERP